MVLVGLVRPTGGPPIGPPVGGGQKGGSVEIGCHGVA